MWSHMSCRQDSCQGLRRCFGTTGAGREELEGGGGVAKAKRSGGASAQQDESHLLHHILGFHGG